MNDTNNILLLDSSQVENNKFILDNAIKGKYKLLSFCFTNNIFNVNNNNNKIYFVENGDNLECSLTNGYYDLNDLKTNISDAMSSVMSGVLTISLDSNTNKFTFSVGTGDDLHFTFGTNTSNSSRKLLGFNEVDGTASNTQISENVVDLNTCKNIFLIIKEDNNRNIKGVNFFNSSFVINGIGSFGEKLRYIDNDNFNQYVKFRNVKTLNLSFVDNNNKTLDLNSEYQLILKKID